MRFAISDLRERPEFFEVVADRIWQAWWKPCGVSRGYIETRLRENLAGPGMPIALVAHDGATFLGTTSLIASDFDERPQYTPWIAAVWTEPSSRGAGVARALVERAGTEAFALGYPSVYLCAPPPRRSFYIELGWTALEDGVGPRQVTIFCRNRPA